MNEDLGTISRCYTITFRRRSKHSTARLWKAITEPGEISAWMGYQARVDPRIGGAWFVDFEEQGDLPGVIVALEEGRELAYSWGLSIVQWKLHESADGGCDYTLVHNGLADRGEGEEGLPAGWHDFLARLDLHLAGETTAREVARARWLALKPAYKAALDRVLRG